MSTHLRRIIALLSMFAASLASAQGSYPDKPIRVIVGFPAGTTGDVIIRMMAPKLGEGLGQAIIVENRPGAGSSIAAEAVARSRPDGYTLLLSTTANVINPSLYTNLSFDFSRDLIPVTLLAEAPALLVGHPSVAATSLAELIALAKAKPDEMTYASSGNGTFTHLAGELFNQSAGVRLTHIPYKGSSQALGDLLTGRVRLLFTPASTVLQYVKAGTLKAFGTIGQQRLTGLPNTPLFSEAGIPGFDSALWFGLNAPAGTPPEVVERLAKEVGRVLARPELKAQLAVQSINTLPGGSAAFAALMKKESTKWAGVIKNANIKPE